MTAQEFNEKYKEYIECREYVGKDGETKKQYFGGLEFDIPEVTEFLDSIFKDLILIPNFTYSQIKMKFGASRFYSSLQSSQLNWLIENEINRIIKNI